MNRFDRPRVRHDSVSIPIIWIAVVLSLLVHFAALWLWLPRSPLLNPKANDVGKSRALIAELAPSRAPPLADAGAAAPAPPPAALPKPETVVPRRNEPAPRPRPTPPKVARAPQITIDKPALQRVEPPPVAPPDVVAPPAPPAPPVAPPRAMPPAPAEDLAAYVEARRRARGETPTASGDNPETKAGESDLERRNRIVASNLGLNRTPTFGRDESNAGGMFQIRELHYDDAQVYFFGFDKDIARNAKQLIEVRRGNNSDIRIAVVRKMIEIIRENVPGDFVWISYRTGRHVTLSARPSDNDALEDFIMRDVF